MEDNERKIIVFPKGIPGFEEENSFELIEDENSPLAQLNSVNDDEIGFVLLPPQLFFQDYLVSVDLSAEEVEIIELDASDTIDVWAIMTLSLSNMNNSTVNLRAPLLVNPRTNKGLQLILSEDKYSSRQRLFADPQNSAEVESAREGAVG